MPPRFHGECHDGRWLALIENLEIALLEPAHGMAARVADHHLQLHQVGLRGEMQLRGRVCVRADADLIRRLRGRNQCACGECTHQISCDPVYRMAGVNEEAPNHPFLESHGARRFQNAVVGASRRRPGPRAVQTAFRRTVAKGSAGAIIGPI